MTPPHLDQTPADVPHFKETPVHPPHEGSRISIEPGPLAVDISPTRAGWQQLTFRVHRVSSDAPLEGRTGNEEAVIVVLRGSGTLEIGDQHLTFTGRDGVFAGLPHFGYVPRQTSYRFTPAAGADAEVAWGSAPCVTDHAPRICTPHDCTVEMRGARNVERQITHLVDPGFGCQRLLCVEVYTPSGNWSSYPPHKHDTHDLPNEVALEEIYHYRMAPDGFALQRLYDDTHDEVVVARDGDTVLVRHGYHPVVAGPGYDVYYLNILAGDHPAWAAADDPQLAWVRQRWNSRTPLRLPMQP